MITRRTFLAGLTLGVAAIALTGCQIDTRTPIKVSQILEVARSGVPSPVAAAITGQFITPAWCKDEGVMAVETISTPDVPLQLQACAPGGSTGAIGTFQMATNLIKTDGGQTDAAILANVLGGDNARFAVFKHDKHGRDLLSVGLFLNVPQLQANQQKLMAMPVYKRGGYDGNVTFTFTLDIINDTDKPANFFLTDVDAGGDLPSDEAILTIPPAGMDTVTLDAQTQANLGTRGWVNFMSLILK
ncbi:MAG: twin-arginine translocation signal domain-containing protein [Aestuariivirga sp.]|uniref:twin-arginine translocation signal domain-containing protein n=1 Tax=Aestuariivirga sp. TaxID=2650926 RepID=UPI0025B83348|nr:twin-arginine translocation signal domain-containing protein [Aestuariivirga sp.]MCA3560114.1 twin-arginine translocation signal domain-containing protein [Aestuariivirga sp.]